MSQVYSQRTFIKLKLLRYRFLITVTKKFPNFEVFQSHFPKSEHFLPISNLKDVIRRFRNVINLTYRRHFMIQYQIQTYVQNLNRLRRHRKNYVIFQKYGRDVTTMTPLA